MFFLTNFRRCFLGLPLPRRFGFCVSLHIVFAGDHGRLHQGKGESLVPQEGQCARGSVPVEKCVILCAGGTRTVRGYSRIIQHTNQMGSKDYIYARNGARFVDGVGVVQERRAAGLSGVASEMCCLAC